MFNENFRNLMNAKNGDYIIYYKDVRWVVEQDDNIISTHSTQQAAIKLADKLGGIDLDDLGKKLVDIWWTDREGKLQGHHDNRRISKPVRTRLRTRISNLFCRR